jgi:phosphoribosylanthranilate isomerase
VALDIKICGIRTPAALDAALEAGADHVGFVFFAPSPRNIALAEAAKLAERARGRADIVALTVDADAGTIAGIVAALRPDVLQLHGSEPPQDLRRLRERHALRLWKAVPVSERADLAAAEPYLALADRIVFDAKPPADATRPGGNARRFDWTLLASLDLAKPFVLSGGLDRENVAEAVRIARAPAVDVSSGVETAPGEKSPEMIRAFVRAARASALAQETGRS